MCSDDLTTFLQETRDTREYTRALAVQMARQGLAYDTIIAVLPVSKPFISKWQRIFTEAGIAGLRIGYRGSAGYLTPEERQQTLAWLGEQQTWSVAALRTYLEETFQVVYQSLQSYYELLHAAGISWHQVQLTNPKKTRRP